MNTLNENYNILEHEIVLWCGDLNYRINSDSFEETLEMIKQNKIFELSKLD